jgi:GAF domain-containing protein
MPHSDQQAIAVLIDAGYESEPLGPTAVSDALDALGLPTGPGGLADRIHRSQREFSRLRRREHELSALFSSARELAELRDIDAVLAHLVQRAHEMMGADIAYLSEFDPDSRELRVRETVGAVSASFQALRVPPGRGLASVVVETRSPQWSADYSGYMMERHDAAIDDAVTSEGLVSLLGVPMLTSDDVLGVLFVGNREQRDFTPDEVALLSALADHASVILRTAQVLQELRGSEETMRRALADLQAHLVERDRANTVHQELVRAVLAGGGFAPVVETLASALGRAAMIVDPQGRIVAAAGSSTPPRVPDPGGQIGRAIADSRRSGHCVAVTAEGLSAVAALAAGSQDFGALLLGDGDFQLGAVDLRTIERAAQVSALLSLQQEAASGAEHRVRSDLVADVLDDVPERRGDVIRRARRLGVDLEPLDRLALFAVPGDFQTASARALSARLSRHALVGEYRGYVVLAFASAPSTQGRPDVEQLRKHLTHVVGRPVNAVVSPPAPLSAAFPRAMRAARLLTALGASDVTVSTDEMLPYSMVLDTDGRALAAFLDEALGGVSRYDAEHGTDLLGTLRAFVRHGASPTRTARALNFHTNTILQRLDRLDGILGEGWRDDERMFRIGMAARLGELQQKLGVGPGHG